MTPSTPSVRAVVFDLDDTLYPERQYVRSGYRAVGRLLAAEFGAPADADEWMWQRFCAGQSQNMFQAAGEHFALAFETGDVERLVAAYRAHRPAIQPDPQAAEALRRLRGHVRLGLLSDGFLPAQQYKLDALKLEKLFDAVIFTESLGREHWKPDPTAFRRVAEVLEAPARACAYVADNPAKDFVAPNALGWRTVQWRMEGQLHADKPAAAGGRPGSVAASAAELLAALGLDAR